jgi:hypothetical protein
VPSVTDSPIWGMVICTVAARVAIRASTVPLRRTGGAHWARSPGVRRPGGRRYGPAG